MPPRFENAMKGLLRVRAFWVGLHRWCGLLLLGFLLIAGTTGAIIAWEREVDAWLNPQLYTARSGGETLGAQRSGVDLVEQIERDHPELFVSYAPLAWKPGSTVIMRVRGRAPIDAVSGRPWKLGFGEIFVDPATGALQGQRLRTALAWERTQWLPMLYRLHHSLCLPGGKWLLGGVAILWSLDCVVALGLSFPHWRAWRKSMRFRWRAGGFKLQFDLHRSGGVWLWFGLLALATTAITMNFKRELVRPALRAMAPLRAAPFEYPRRLRVDGMPVLSRQQILERAEGEARRLGIELAPGAIAWSMEQNLYGIDFSDPLADPSGQGGRGLGAQKVFFDAQTGEPVHVILPGSGSLADAYYDLQFPLHSGRILGLLGRGLISALGMAIALLCVTGVLIWHRKRSARLFQRQRIGTMNAERAGL